MNKLFLAVIFSAPIFAHQSFQSSYSQNKTPLPPEVIQELKQKQHAHHNQTKEESQASSSDMPSKTKIGLKMAGGVALTIIGLMVTISAAATALRPPKESRFKTNVGMAACGTCSITTLYQGAKLLSGAYNDYSARAEVITLLQKAKQTA